MVVLLFKAANVLWQYWNNNTLPAPTPKRVTTRLLMTLENGRVVSSMPVGDDVMVFERSQIPVLLQEPGLFSVNDLADIAQTANQRLAELLLSRIGYH